MSTKKTQAKISLQLDGVIVYLEEVAGKMPEGPAKKAHEAKYRDAKARLEEHIDLGASWT